MARFCVLASSSAGQQHLHILRGGRAACRRGNQLSKNFQKPRGSGEELGKIAGILLTHEHADHVKGLRILTKNTGAPVYATAPVLRYLEENALVDSRSKLG